MARSALTVQQIARTGIVPSYAAANVAGNSLANSGKEFLHIKNGAVSSITVTIETPGTVDGQAVADRTVTIGAGAEKMIGPFPPQTYNQDSGEVYVDYSAITTVTVGAFRLA